MEPEWLLDGRVVLHHADCLAAMGALAPESVDAIVTDPPYHLGFMGKKWDRGDVAFRATTWAEALRVLKPGGHLVAFGGTRTYHRLAVAIEDAGFEIRDMIAWQYATGFPKSHDVSKAIDKAAGEIPIETGEFKRASIQRIDQNGEFSSHPEETKRVAVTRPATLEAAEWAGWGTALKPALEPICPARKPLSEKTVGANVLRWGTGALNIDACRIGTEEDLSNHARSAASAISKGVFSDSSSQETHQTAGQRLGRWPANIVHDGSPEVLAVFPDAHVNAPGQRSSPAKGIYEGGWGARKPFGYDTDGSAARFFYSAKADRDDRVGSKHPTVKPVDLMQWLCRLITPPGGLVLDPFAGTGTTGEAAWREGFCAALIESEAEYCDDIRRRMRLAPQGVSTRRRETIKASGPNSADDCPLFAAATGAAS